MKYENLIRLMLVDDHPVMRLGIRKLLEREADFEVVAEAGDGEEAIELVSSLKPDMVLMDVGLPKKGGLETTRCIKNISPDTAVLVLTVHAENNNVREFIDAGAMGYLLKHADGDKIVRAIRSILAGDMVFDPTIAHSLLNHSPRAEKPANSPACNHLSNRESQVIKLGAKGMSNQKISAELGISLRSVKGHWTNIMNKIGAHSRTEAVVRAIRLGLIILEDTE